MNLLETWFAPPLGTAFALVSMLAYRVLAGRPTPLVASAGVALILGFMGFARFGVLGGLTSWNTSQTRIVGLDVLTVGVDFALAAVGIALVGAGYWLMRDSDDAGTRPGLVPTLLLTLGVLSLVAEAVNATFQEGPYMRMVTQKVVAFWISVISLLSGGIVAWGATALGLLRRLRGERSGAWGRDDSD